jgi:ribosomal protein S11
VGDDLIITHIKCYRSNYFFILVTNTGKVVFTKTTGSLGFFNMQKRSVEAFSTLLETGFKQVSTLKKKYIFFKVEGIKLSVLKFIYKKLFLFLKKNQIIVVGLQHRYKNSHNGCRQKK